MIDKLALYGASALLARSRPAVAHDGLHPTDAQICPNRLHGQLDLEEGKQALATSSNAEVRAFADTMARDHAAVNEQALALLNKLGVKPETNATSEALAKQGKEKERELSTLRGAAFDRACIQNEVAYHRTVNGALSSTLIRVRTTPNSNRCCKRVRTAAGAASTSPRMCRPCTGRMRLLIGLGMDRPARNLDVGAVVLDLVLNHDLRDQLHRFVDHRLELGEVVAERAGLLLRAALAHPEM